MFFFLFLKQKKNRRRCVQQKETPTQPDHVHHVSAARARASIRKVPLSGRLFARGARHESKSAGSTSSGEFGRAVHKKGRRESGNISVHVLLQEIQSRARAIRFIRIIYWLEEDDRFFSQRDDWSDYVFDTLTHLFVDVCCTIIDNL